MRNRDRIPRILFKLQSVWEKYPDMRFSQLFYAINKNNTKEAGLPYYYTEDDLFEKGLDEFIAENQIVVSGGWKS